MSTGHIQYLRFGRKRRLQRGSFSILESWKHPKGSLSLARRRFLLALWPRCTKPFTFSQHALVG